MNSEEPRHKYETGAERSADCDDVRYDLITPIGLRALAKTYAEGATKFGAHNWENGMPATDMLNHAISHVFSFLGGDRTEDHLGHAAWNILGAIHSIEKWPELNSDMLRGPGCTVPPGAAKQKQPAIPGSGNAPWMRVDSVMTTTTVPFMEKKNA
jgi:hypothetical protein